MDIMILTVGEPLAIMLGQPEGCRFFIRDDGMYLIINFQSPTQDEIEQVDSGSDFEMRWTIVDGIIMITVKLGNLKWMDAPFAPQLEIDTGHLHIDDLSGLPLMIIMTDAPSAIIKKLRLIGPSASFISSMINAMKIAVKTPLSLSDYLKRVNAIYSRYSTSDLVMMGSSNIFRLSDFSEGEKSTVRKSLASIAPYVSKRLCKVLSIPKELEPYHYYVSDAGHCITCIPQILLDEAKRTKNFDGYEVPVPAKYVLEHGYSIMEGYVVVDVPYDATFGVVVDEEYDIFD